MSITNPSEDSPFPYFRGKARLERSIRESGLSCAIIRPTVIAVLAGLAAGSVALLGFGIDSFVESASGSVLIWRLLAERRSADDERVEQIERRAERLVGISLFLLAGYIALDAGYLHVVGADVSVQSAVSREGGVALGGEVALYLARQGDARRLDIGFHPTLSGQRHLLFCRDLAFDFSLDSEGAGHYHGALDPGPSTNHRDLRAVVCTIHAHLLRHGRIAPALGRGGGRFLRAAGPDLC